MSNLYLYSVTNNHPEVLRTFKYLVIADSKLDVERKMKYADGGLNKYCTNITIEELNSVNDNIWYLPIYIPEIVSVSNETKMQD